MPSSGNSGGGGGTTNPTPTAPNAPTNVTAQVISDTQINLSWTASSSNSGVGGYYVYRNGAKLGPVTNGTTFGDSGLAAATTYSYYVVAFNSAGNSTASTTVKAATQQAPTTGQPEEKRTGTLSGTVKTARGNAIQSVLVSVTYGSAVHSALTNSAGKYTLTSVPTGKYTVVFSKTGLEAKTASATIEAGKTATLNITMSDSKVTTK